MQTSHFRTLFAREQVLPHLLYRSISKKVNGSNIFDVVVVGGGIVGTATARELIFRHPNLKMAIVEKEENMAKHQSGNNSGVIHAGIYYKPGSLKAKLCVEGLHLAYEYLDANNIPYKKCGKLIVAADPIELPALQELYERSKENNVPDVEMIPGNRIKDIEPHCMGFKAIWSPHTGIVDWGLVTKSFAKDFKSKGGEIFLNFEVTGFTEQKNSEKNNKYNVCIQSKNTSMLAQYVVVCGGLYSDVLAQMCGLQADPKILPFRGEYLLLNRRKTHLIKGNIYPVPDPRYPFLGVHFTPRMDGSVWLGPNAVPATKREGYSWKDFDKSEFLDLVKYPGFRKLAFKYFGFGSMEVFKSIFIDWQVRELQRYIPEISRKDVKRGPAGVRAQAADINGNLVDDFVFDIGKEGSFGRNILHCRNAPSPGATSSLAIAKMIADKARQSFNFDR